MAIEESSNNTMTPSTHPQSTQKLLCFTMAISVPRFEPCRKHVERREKFTHNPKNVKHIEIFCMEECPKGTITLKHYWKGLNHVIPHERCGGDN